MEVVGEACDGEQAIELAGQLRPDVVIMDITMPGMNGVLAATEIVRSVGDVDVLMLSVHTSRRVVADALRAGASGYVAKTSPMEEVVRAVRAVAAGKTYLSPDIAGDVVDGFLRRTDAAVAPCPPSLNDRERRVLQLVAEGKSTKEISRLLAVPAKTIEWNRHCIMNKLGLRSIAELTKYAIREGLTPLDS